MLSKNMSKYAWMLPSNNAGKQHYIYGWILLNSPPPITLS